MRTIHRIGIGFLVGLFFAGGYAARGVSARHEVATGMSQQGPVSAPGIPIASARLEGGANIDLRPLETMLTVLKHLREHYVEQLSTSTEGKMTHESLRMMLASLNDPNTRFLEPKQRELVTDAEQGKYHGIGAMLGVKGVKNGGITEEHLVVIAPLEGGPAQKAGLKPGDDIVEIDGKPILPFNPFQRAESIIKDEWNTRKMEQSEVKKHLKAEQERVEKGIGIVEAENLLVSDGSGDEKGKPVEVAVMRKGSTEPLKMKVERRTFTVTPVTSSTMANGVGYIRINCLASTTADDLQKSLADLRGGDAKSLVLDLRNLAGGSLSDAVAVAEPFIPGKTLAVELRSRGRKNQVNVPGQKANVKWDAPVVVLVNGGTARMPEIVAAALKENLGARLVGEKTYGDFATTTMIDQRDGSAFVMTTGALLTSKGGNYEGKGLPVDVATASASPDQQLKAAVKLAANGGKG